LGKHSKKKDNEVKIVEEVNRKLLKSLQVLDRRCPVESIMDHFDKVTVESKYFFPGGQFFKKFDKFI